MINAEEARLNIKKYCEENVKTILEEISSIIRSASRDGRFHTNYTISTSKLEEPNIDFIVKSIIDNLTEKGFKISIKETTIYYYTKIDVSWAE